MAINFLKALGAISVCTLFVFGTTSKNAPVKIKAVLANQTPVKPFIQVVNICDID